jgi:hypothetical protein
MKESSVDIPLVLKEKGKLLVYRIPVWYRIAMILIGLVLVGAIIVAGEKPSAFEWILLGLCALAGLYEERWKLDGETGFLSHRYGLVFLAKTITSPFSRIEGFRLRAFVRGSTPGAPGEEEESRRILSSLDPMNDAKAYEKGKSRPKKAYVSLICDDLEGGGLVVNTLPARRVAELRLAGLKFSGCAGKSFTQE